MICLMIYTNQPQVVSPTLKAWAYPRTCPTTITSRRSPRLTESPIPTIHIKHPMWLMPMHHQRPVSMCRNQSR